VVTLSVIVPTLGRATLETALSSIRDQGFIDGDEVLVVGDGPQPAAVALVENLGRPFRYLEHGPCHDYGDSQRNFAMPQATGDYLVFVDDDNTMLPNAFLAIRQMAKKFPKRPLIFRVRFTDGRPAPSGPKLILGDYDTACGVFPRDPARLAHWKGMYGGDYEFAKDTLALYPNGEAAAVWCKPIIGVHRPHLLPGFLNPTTERKLPCPSN
jgi:glycosyltransferase involved in cell wall biosynthesis